MTHRFGDQVESACPSCGSFTTREVYDIGSGPELSCADCEWCWGANGQTLQPYRSQIEGPPDPDGRDQP